MNISLAVTLGGFSTITRILDRMVDKKSSTENYPVLRSVVDSVSGELSDVICQLSGDSISTNDRDRLVISIAGKIDAARLFVCRSLGASDAEFAAC